VGQHNHRDVYLPKSDVQYLNLEHLGGVDDDQGGDARAQVGGGLGQQRGTAEGGLQHRCREAADGLQLARAVRMATMRRQSAVRQAQECARKKYMEAIVGDGPMARGQRSE
jgi:hypothetical protein